ncbi:MAG: hypothetical protein U0R50_17695 [Gaiellales bacterium]
MSYHEIQPEPDDHVFTVEVEVWVDAERRPGMRRKDRSTPRASKRSGAWSSASVTARASASFRHIICGMASRTASSGESGRDFVALQRLMGHSRPDTTQAYVDDLELDDLLDALARAADHRPPTLELSARQRRRSPRSARGEQL